MEFGQLYRSAGILGAGPELPAALGSDQWAGQPGTRAPHLWLLREGAEISTLDLLRNSWVLLTQEEEWNQAVTAARETFNVRLGFYCIEASALTPELFQKSLGVGRGGALLIRPDGYIAWRSQELPRDMATLLSDALKASFARTRDQDVDEPFRASRA